MNAPYSNDRHHLARRVLTVLALALAVGPACAHDRPAEAGDDAEPAEPGSGAEYELLPVERRLLRASMALRGTRPSVAEYDAVSEDPEAFEALVDGYLDQPAFTSMVRQHFTEWLELDQAPDVYPAGFPAVGALEGMSTHALNTSIIQAPGRLAEHIVTHDRPWSEIVTAEYTLADEVVATVWGLPYDLGSGGWQVTDYADERPRAGVLSDGWVFTRMPSTENNRHRERASLIANALICHDYPGRPVRIPPEIDLTDEATIANAIEDNEICVGCHQTLDPLAAAFAVHYALRLPEYEISYPLVQYTPEEAQDYEDPAWYGVPIADLRDLGQAIAEDPRFSSCAVRRFYSELMHVPAEDVPQLAVARYLPVFVDSGLNVRALVRAIVLSPEFAAVRAVPGGEVQPVEVGLRRATSQQLDRLFADLVGYRWHAQVDMDLGGGRVGSVPLMLDYLWGYRTLAGGPNNFDTTTHLRTADPSTVLVLRALAERAARATLEHDRSAAEPHLLTISGALQGDPAAVTTQLVALRLRLFGERLEPGDEALTSSEALYATAFDASGDPLRAWEVTLAALFQDPAILYY